MFGMFGGLKRQFLLLKDHSGFIVENKQCRNKHGGELTNSKAILSSRHKKMVVGTRTVKAEIARS